MHRSRTSRKCLMVGNEFPVDRAPIAGPPIFPSPGGSFVRRRFRVAMWSLSILLLSTPGSPAVAAPPRPAHTELAEARAAFDRGAFESAVESGTRAARLFQEAGDHAGQIAALIHVAEGYSALGQYRQSVGVLDRALEVAEASGDRSQVPWILSRLGSPLIATGPPQAAEATLRRALGMAREAADRPLAAGLLNDLGNQLASRKEMPEALANYRESAALAESSGRGFLVAQPRINEARGRPVPRPKRAPRSTMPSIGWTDRALRGRLRSRSSASESVTASFGRWSRIRPATCCCAPPVPSIAVETLPMASGTAGPCPTHRGTSGRYTRKNGGTRRRSS